MRVTSLDRFNIVHWKALDSEKTGEVVLENWARRYRPFEAPQAQLREETCPECGQADNCGDCTHEAEK